jgi:NADH-quinone oxidoreductase subunit G
MSGGQDPAAVDLWAWLGRQNPILAQVGSLTDHPEGVRLLPAARVEGDFTALPSPAPEPGPDQLELLLVDWTFGTEELASYAAILHEAEAAPVLSIHPGAAAKAGLSDGDGVVLHLPKGPLGVVVKLAENLAPGVVVLPRHRRLDWRKLAETPVYLAFDQIERERG